MSSEEVRKNFLEFFKKKGHTIVPSSSLIPDDPSVLFTTAGMQQFKPYYTFKLNALKDFGSQRTVSCQKCFRTSDIEEVGDKTHLTFFEMLGNFSFGPVGIDDPEDFSEKGYFKRSSIHWAYEFITQILGINTNRIMASVFEGDGSLSNGVQFDKESFDVWHKEIGLPKNKIVMGNRADNFWGPTGDEGPCGPTSEIYVDEVEIWNLVFNEYYKEKNGELRKLENPGVDTGMGLERLIAVLQGIDDVFETDVFETDVFKPLVLKINEIAPNLDKRMTRILADHLRASIFLSADGIKPSNKETGYILRRLLRRILAYSIKYDIHADLFLVAVEIIKDKFGKIYPEIKKIKIILGILEEERQKFQGVVVRGIKEIEKLALNRTEITGQIAFYLYETFGLPFELIKELAPKEIIKNLNKETFEEEFKKHQKVSRAGAEKKFGGHGLLLDTGELKAASGEEVKKVIRLHTATHLLHFALREILGKDIKQMGSDITPDRTRFDFSFNRKITPEEIQKVEDLVNQQIRKDLPVYYKEMPIAEAEKTGALHFFKQKYPEIVKVYFIGSESSGGVLSLEFCGGPHMEHTLEIGKFKIIKEESVGVGTRRIRATVE